MGQSQRFDSSSAANGWNRRICVSAERSGEAAIWCTPDRADALQQGRTCPISRRPRCHVQLYRVQFENRGPAGARPIAGPRARLVPRTGDYGFQTGRGLNWLLEISLFETTSITRVNHSRFSKINLCVRLLISEYASGAPRFLIYDSEIRYRPLRRGLYFLADHLILDLLHQDRSSIPMNLTTKIGSA